MKGKIFNAQQVQSMISGNMVMFREVIKPQPFEGNSTYKGLNIYGEHLFYPISDDESLYDDDLGLRKCPYKVGQKIFCKESFGLLGPKCPVYLATINPCLESSIKWKPPQHMKQEHSRLFPIIKEIRVERLQNITQEDAAKEGINGKSCDRCSESGEGGRDCAFPSWKENFIYLWNKAHKKPEEKFEVNPWVWVVSCEVVK
jgi:hypothetical protein